MVHITHTHMAVRQQDYQFVEQSKSVSLETYDVARIISHLRDIGRSNIKIADIGGGIGSVGLALVTELPGILVDVIDSSELAAAQFNTHDGLNLISRDYFDWSTTSKYDALIFRTVLHHFVAASARETRQLQIAALEKAKGLLKDDGLVFVTENFYEPILGTDLSGELIYQLTKLKSPARLFRSMGANTAGEGGVRFRSYAAWKELFSLSGFDIVSVLRLRWHMPLWQRIPLLCLYRFQALVVLKKSAV